MLKAKVTRPAFDEENSEVTLTATIKHGTETKTKEFKVLVKKEGITDSQAVVLDLTMLQIPEETKEDINLPNLGANNSIITWASDTPSVLSDKGVVNRPNVGDEDAIVVLTATATRGMYSETKEFSVIVNSWTYEEELTDAKEIVTWDLIKGSNVNQFAITNDLNLPASIGRGVSATWTTVTQNCDASTGKITRPTYVQGPVELRLTCKLEHHENEAVVELGPYTIAAEDMTPQDILDMASNLLDASKILGTNVSLNAITEDMILPVRFNESEVSLATITWSLATKSGNTYTDIATHNNISLFVNPDHVLAEITRPTISEGNQSVSLKAKITVDDGTSSVNNSKHFDLTILVE